MRGYHRYRWQLAQKKYERRMKGVEMVCAETIYRWIWPEKRRGNDEMARKSLGYLTPIEYCKKMFNFEFGVRCTSK